ncbi:BPI fold-containing family A member 1 [Rousettus aegyptiacus]|uniref:BPI fold-containing family A member 1 n=1 Tax=Rousettus aegyptiacus TaxID=9407 RepID=A0A7J8DFD9_ROUAE|nr:BPI fold-containing family A member 1 [Rousettus aegyptiacus]KAF6421765.1 BPI fold containing family A member 1 [Rousettus aegyptiacus]
MFQIRGLIVFCGLLAQLQALSLPPALKSASPTDLAGNLTNALSNGLISGGLLDNLSNLPLLDALKPGKGNPAGLVGLLGKLTSSIPILNSFVDLKITNSELLELGLEQSPDGHHLYVTIPLGFVLNLKAPLLGSLLKVSVKLNITAEVFTVTDDEQKTHLVVGDCTHSPGNLQITLLDGHGFILQKLLDDLTIIFNKILPELVQKQVCPLVNALLSQLDITLVDEIINQLIQGTHFVIKI